MSFKCGWCSGTHQGKPVFVTLEARDVVYEYPTEDQSFHGQEIVREIAIHPSEVDNLPAMKLSPVIKTVTCRRKVKKEEREKYHRTHTSDLEDNQEKE